MTEQRSWTSPETHASIAQRGEYPNILLLDFLFSRSKAISAISRKNSNRIDLTTAVTFAGINLHCTDIYACTISPVPRTRRKFPSSPTQYKSIVKTRVVSNIFAKGEASWKITGQSQKLI